MNKFVIVNGLPYLYADGKTYAVRWDEKGFTVGAEVELTSVPSVTYSEISIKAKCAGHLDSIGKAEITPDEPEGSADDESVTPDEPEQQEKDLEEMTLAELKDYAKEHDIALNGARTKDAIIEAIMGAE